VTIKYQLTPLNTFKVQIYSAVDLETVSVDWLKKQRSTFDLVKFWQHKNNVLWARLQLGVGCYRA